MGLAPVKETVGAVRDVFIKVFELFTGGFTIAKPKGFTGGVNLPKGSFLKVDESTRTATPIKTALTAATPAGASGIYLPLGHPFIATDVIALEGQGTSSAINLVENQATKSYIRVAAAITDTGVATGTVVYQAASAGTTTAARAPKDVPNGILRYDTTLATGEEATVALRASVYKNRLPDVHTSAHRADLKLIHFSDSK